MQPKPFEPRVEVYKRIERKRKDGEVVSSHKSFKELNLEEIKRLKEIKVGRESFLKKIGLIGKKKDIHLDIRKYDEYKQKFKELQEKSRRLDKVYKNKLNNLYKEALLQSFAIAYLKKDVIQNLENQALKKRLIKLFESKLGTLDSYIYPKWDGQSYVYNSNIQKKYPRLYKHFAEIGSWNKYTGNSSHYNQNPEVLKVLFKKYPFLLENKNPKERSKQLELEKQINNLLVNMEQTSKDLKKPFETYVKLEQKKLMTAQNEFYGLDPIIWDKEIDELFQKRYAVSLTRIYNLFDKARFENKEVRPIKIIDNILNTSLKEPTLLVFPLNGSLFNYFLTKGVISEIKRLKLNKYDLDAVTISAHGFEYKDFISGNISRPYGNNWNDIRQRAPDIVSGQIKNIIKKHSDISRITMVDMISSGFQKGYLDYYFEKGFIEAGRKTPGYRRINENDPIKLVPTFDALSVHEYQEFTNDNENININNVVNKIVNENQKEGKIVYQNPLKSEENIAQREKAREMLEVAGRMLLRAELKTRTRK